MDSKNQCPNCGKKIESWFVYCEFCGNTMKPESIDKKPPSSTLKSNVQIEKIPATESSNSKQVITVPVQKQEKYKWYTPPKRKRPWYHPLELFFWLGWGLYVILRLLIVEFLMFIKWCCWWGPPSSND